MTANPTPDYVRDHFAAHPAIGALMRPMIQSSAAVKPGKERLFPHSRHRSVRTHKKLVKRHGGVYRDVPAMYRMGDTIVCHPALYHDVRAAIRTQK